MVSVKLHSKGIGGNHQPKFRITGENKLDNAQSQVARAIQEMLSKIPDSQINQLIYRRDDTQSFADFLTALSMESSDSMARPIFNGWREGARYGAEAVREGVNTELKRLGSNVRVVGSDDKLRYLTKSLDKVEWKVSFADFDKQPDNMDGKVYARFRTARIFEDLTSDIEENIATTIANGFTASQAFSTGRSVTGLTPQQTARALFGILQDVNPLATGADYASTVSIATQGLTSQWAKAVENHMNAVAKRLLDIGVPPVEALKRVKAAGLAYGNKLRRARARMIARTEIASAQNVAVQDMYERAIADDVITSEDLKEWITGPYDVCKICVPMGGRTVPVRNSFQLPNGNVKQYPPAHPNCRCITRLVPSYFEPPVRIGSNTLEDPYRYVFPSGWVAGLPPTK